MVLCQNSANLSTGSKMPIQYEVIQMSESKKQLLAALAFLALAVPGGALVFIKFEFPSVLLCGQAGSSFDCIEILRSVAEFMIRYPALFGLALVDSIGGVSAGLYKFRKYLEIRAVLLTER